LAHYNASGREAQYGRAVDMNLRGKRALVTGSSAGIGAGIARMLAGEGVAVVVHGRNEARAGQVAAGIRAAGGQAAVALGDLGSEDEAAGVARAAVGAFGGIDILVNNAGGRHQRAANAWFDLTAADWLDTFNVNVVSAVRLIKILAGPMRERAWGRIINISSLGGQSTSGQLAEYAAAKAAMNNLTVGLAKVLSKTGVTVNTVSPGMVATEAYDGMLRAVAEREGLGGDLEAAARWMLANAVRQTVGRVGRPDDIAFAVTCLASPLSDFVNGANIRVDGGASPAVN
jgi:NAD(P)-dependent dehydrogenase (short-subunit alcohol dehydrogenase family)